MSAVANSKASKKDLKETRQYLEKIDSKKVEPLYGKGQYVAWHGDGKSQSQTNITFQTRSQQTSGKPTEYITIAAKKKSSDAYVTYTDTKFPDPKKPEEIQAVIDAMIAVLPA